MNRRAAGVNLLAIAAGLYASRYVSAAIFGSNVGSWDAALFGAMLQYVGTPLQTLSILAAAAGVAYLVWAEVGERRP